MLESFTLQWLILPFGLLLLCLHVGPLLGIADEPSIRGGTRWWFFAFEFSVFVGWLLASPIVWNSEFARAVVGLHLVVHASLAIGDWFAHDRMLDTALSPRRSSPWMWTMSKAALLIDTLTHVTVVVLVVVTLPWQSVALVGLPALLGYVLVTHAYVQRFGVRRAEGVESWPGS